MTELTTHPADLDTSNEPVCMTCDRPLFGDFERTWQRNLERERDALRTRVAELESSIDRCFTPNERTADLCATLDDIERLLGVADSDDEGAGIVALRAVIEERDELAVTLASLREDYDAIDPHPLQWEALWAKCDAQRNELHALNVAIRERDRLTDARIAELEAQVARWREWARDHSNEDASADMAGDAENMGAVSSQLVGLRANIRRLQSQLDDEQTEVELTQTALAGESRDNDCLRAASQSAEQEVARLERELMLARDDAKNEVPIADWVAGKPITQDQVRDALEQGRRDIERSKRNGRP